MSLTLQGSRRRLFDLWVLSTTIFKVRLSTVRTMGFPRLQSQVQVSVLFWLEGRVRPSSLGENEHLPSRKYKIRPEVD